MVKFSSDGDPQLGNLWRHWRQQTPGKFGPFSPGKKYRHIIYYHIIQGSVPRILGPRAMQNLPWFLDARSQRRHPLKPCWPPTSLASDYFYVLFFEDPRRIGWIQPGNSWISVWKQQYLNMYPSLPKWTLKGQFCRQILRGASQFSLEQLHDPLAPATLASEANPHQSRSWWFDWLMLWIISTGFWYLENPGNGWFNLTKLQFLIGNMMN